MSNTLTLIVMFALGAFVGAGLTLMITYAQPPALSTQYLAQQDITGGTQW